MTASIEIPLFRRAKQLAERVPHIPLGSFPSAIDEVVLDTGSRSSVPMLVKRDDISAPGYAGNKVRKLEFLLADAREHGVKRLITVGAAGSHHAFATAYHGRNAGFDVTLVLFPQPVTPHVREMLLLDAAVGAELVWVGRMSGVPLGILRARLAHLGERTRVIAPGGSSEVGTLGYINGALELADQIDAGHTAAPSSIHVAAGTLGTAAGIAIGLAWAGHEIPVVATRITSRVLTNERMLASLVRSTIEFMKRMGAHDLPDDERVMRLVTMRHDQIGAGYGRATAAGARATEVFTNAGLTLDDTYTAKAAASALEDAQRSDAAPLFWHTLSAIAPQHLLATASPAMLPPRFADYLADDANAPTEAR